MRPLLRLFVFVLMLASAPADAQLYRATLIQAAPGRLLELIDAEKGRLPIYDAAGEPRPWVLRHSQGDHWDLLVLEPLGESLAAYYAADRIARRTRAATTAGRTDDQFEEVLRELSAWREDEIVRGPLPAQVNAAFGENTFAHVEMFIALAGKQGALVKEREMENAFQRRIGRPENLIFTRVSGAAWDSFTIGLYRNLQHYAAASDLAPAVEDSAATASGFANRAAIGPYLRTLINSHHDSLLGVVR